MSKRVVFDIGHGIDTWPPNKGVYLPDGSSFAEHSFNSAVALKARELAEAHGFEVLFTQEPGQKDVPIGTRATWVNAEHKKAPISCLISFHANASASNTKASGWSAFHWYSSENGRRLAELWAAYAKKLLLIGPWSAGSIWGCKPDTWYNFDIVRKPVVPCILVEHFFFTTLDELGKCNTAEYIDLCAEVAVRALCDYAGVVYQEPVKTNHWAEGAYKYLTEEKGITIHDRRFDDAITRGEVIALMARMQGYS